MPNFVATVMWSIEGDRDIRDPDSGDKRIHRRLHLPHGVRLAGKPAT